MTEHNEKKQAFENNDDFGKQSKSENAASDICRDDLTEKSTEILKECFDAQITKRLKENPPEIPTYEQFSAMIDKDQRARRRHKRRITGIAACFVAAVLIGVFAFGLPGSDVDADNNPKEEITTEDGVIIEDGGWGSSEEEDNVWVTDDWEHVADAKELFPDMLIPKYVPEGYEFEKLTIENYIDEDITCEFVFSNQKNEKLEIEENIIYVGLNTLQISEFSKKISCDAGMIYVQDENKIATIQFDDGIIVHIIGEVSEEDLVYIVQKLIP